MMDQCSELILTRARELLACDDLAADWIDASVTLDSGTIERQEKYLSLAEDQLLFEGRIVRRPELA
jgi:hypothetical protein